MTWIQAVLVGLGSGAVHVVALAGAMAVHARLVCHVAQPVAALLAPHLHRLLVLGVHGKASCEVG